MLSPNAVRVLCPKCHGDFAPYNQFAGVTEYCLECGAGWVLTTEEAVVKRFLRERMDRCVCIGYDCECGGFAASVLEGIMREEEKENGKRNPVGS